jgi:hypothetical protein
MREKTTLEDPGLDGRIILKLYVKKRGVHRIHHSRDTCVCVRVRACLRDGPVYLKSVLTKPWLVAPSHHGMARPQGGDGGTASNMESSWEYIE